MKQNGSIFFLLTYIIVAAAMIGIGIFQWKSKKPVGFYSGVKPPEEDELSDVDAWNKKHACIWMVYGVVIIISAVAGVLIGDSVWIIVPACGGTLLPLPVMIWYHNKLVRMYMK